MSWDPSPGQRKVVFVCIVLALAAVGVYLTAPGLFGDGSDGRSSVAAPTTAGSADRVGESTPAGVSPSASATISTPSPSEPELPDSGPYEKTVLRFARGFTNTERSAEAWHDAVAPYCTTELAKALSYTDPETVPDGEPTGKTRPVAMGETSVQVEVPLDSGTSILVTVVADDEGYAVSDVRPGEAG